MFPLFTFYIINVAAYIIYMVYIQLQIIISVAICNTFLF